MSHRTSTQERSHAGYVSLSLVAVLFSCSSDKTDGGTPDGGMVDTGVADASSPDVGRPTDLGITVIHDAGVPLSCTETCGCPQGQACIGGRCRRTGSPVWCCEKPGCPAGAACLGPNDVPDSCEGPPPVPDAGPRPDVGPGGIGAYCEGDPDCDQALGLTCWERNEPPYFWGYCTLEGCDPVCPTGSECIQINFPEPEGPILGCMQSCTGDPDCRPDAHCFADPRICIPDCRDDLFDCSPRDGTEYCSPTAGVCEPNTTHDTTAVVGDPCLNSTDCNVGEICMGEFAWSFPGGMCTRVCSGLTEATPCGANETCQDFAGIGLCFADCTGGACPNRVNAVCGSIDPNWVVNSCIPQ